MQGTLVLLLLGLLLITANELMRTQAATQVQVKYIPRDLDAWFKDPENQPMYVYNSMFGDNIRM
jgi:hypothetical protein